MTRIAMLLLAGAAAVAGAASSTRAADGCEGFKWDVSKEHALFAGSAAKLSAGKNMAAAPVLVADRLYELELTPQTDVAFALPPAKKMLTDGAFAGVATFQVAATGTYRVSVDVPFWIDVIAGGALVTSKDFGGQQGCLPHKLVLYDLNAGQPLILQMSAASKQTVHVTITRAPSAAT